MGEMMGKDIVEDAQKTTIVIFQIPHIPRVMIGIACQILNPFRLQRVEKWISQQRPQHLVRIVFELDWKVVEVYLQANEVIYIVHSTLWEQGHCSFFGDLFIFHLPFVQVCFIGFVVGAEFMQNSCRSFKVEFAPSQFLADFTFSELPLAFQKLHEILF